MVTRRKGSDLAATKQCAHLTKAYPSAATAVSLKLGVTCSFINFKSKQVMFCNEQLSQHKSNEVRKLETEWSSSKLYWSCEKLFAVSFPESSLITTNQTKTIISSIRTFTFSLLFFSLFLFCFCFGSRNT